MNECRRTLLVYAFCKIETSTFVRHEGGFQLDTEMSMIALKTDCGQYFIAAPGQYQPLSRSS